MAVSEAAGKDVQLFIWLLENWFILAAIAGMLAVVQLMVWLRKKTKKPFLDPSTFQPLPLVEKTWISHNTVRLRFSLSEPDQRLGLPIGQHITFLAKDDDGKDVYRPYTPVSDDDQLGSVDFVIKIYPQGKMSQIINKLDVRDTMLMKGPRGKFTYERNTLAHIGMLAGGTGITPMYQVITAILKDPKDRTTLSLIYGNISEEDILLRKELDELAAMHGTHRLTVHYVLNKPPQGWDGSSGFITRDMISLRVQKPGPGVKVLCCGPPPMVEAMKGHLDELGYAPESQFTF